MALTATATEEVKKDILRKLAIERTAAVFKVTLPCREKPLRIPSYLPCGA
jgi:superfamily II DNA helicase RecQ